MLEGGDQDDRDKDAASRLYALTSCQAFCLPLSTSILFARSTRCIPPWAMLIQFNIGLDDLCVRFIINLPQEELESVERICFQVEEAQWYYEDFIRPLDPDLPSLNLRNFCLRIFQHCPLLSEFSPDHHATAFEEFLAYKTRVPVRGAIMLNDGMDEVILVKGWKKGANWSFPRGKINKDESDLACAIREVYEETGYDVEAAGLIDSPETTMYIDVAIQHQHIRLYVFRGVPTDTAFEARTRKEISKIAWWKLSDLPTLKKKKQQQEGRGEDLASNANKFYMVAPFLVPLKKWISQQKKMEQSKVTHQLQPRPGETGVLPTGSNELNTTQAVAVSEDMERLLAGLRQPARIPTGNPQVSNMVASASQASQHLKELLRVRPQDAAENSMQKSSGAPIKSAPLSAEAKRASTLLALLKGGPPTQAASAPQIPKEEPVGVSTTPAHPFAAENSAQLQSNLSSGSIEAAVAAWNNFETTAAEQEAAQRTLVANKLSAQIKEEKRTGSRHEPTLPTMDETWRQVKGDQNATMRQTGQRQIANVVKRSVGGPQHSYKTHQSQTADATQQQAAPNPASITATAPYQATSRVQVATNSQYPDIYRPAIPAANKLPMPKLTAHSSSLLNLFKREQPTKAAQNLLGSSTADVKPNSQPQDLLVRNKEEAISSPESSNILGMSAAPKPSVQKRPQSDHQAALLELFRKPSVSGDKSISAPRAMLDVPAGLVELSAMPSPGLSRIPPKSNTKGSPNAPASISGKPATLQKRPQVKAKHGQPPVFATVSGPLNVPHFEMIANRARDSAQKPGVAKDVKKSPVRILARPSNANVDNSIQQTGELDLNNSRADGSSVVPPAGLSNNSKKSPSPKHFQPQILRRPPQPKEGNEAATSFDAPNVRKPLASPNREPITPVKSSGLSGHGSDSPSRLPAPPKSPSKAPPSEMETPLRGDKHIREAYKEKDAQSFAEAPASLKSGQLDPRRLEESEPAVTESGAQAHQQPPGPQPVPPSGEKREAPSPLSASDRRLPMRPDHKATLLSLFTKTSSPTTSRPSSRPDLSAFVSPVAPSFPWKNLNDEMADTKSSSITLADDGIGDGAAKNAVNSDGSQQMPKKTTSDADRKFLLGYLEGVARKEGK
ncbi:MAG: hypothetical protein LQ341_003257 [Variospora aurantia]|nr:MAG: hypothetical protein LQ341_003257 [Variospora aurantia]